MITTEMVIGWSFSAGFFGGLGLACAWITYWIAMKIWNEMRDI